MPYTQDVSKFYRTPSPVSRKKGCGEYIFAAIIIALICVALAVVIAPEAFINPYFNECISQHLSDYCSPIQIPSFGEWFYYATH